MRPGTEPVPMIYLDNHATTAIDPAVLERMLPFFTTHYGNASSRHHDPGLNAHAAVEGARAQLAAAIGAEPREIIFTSGATESNNLALRGGAEALRGRGDHIVTVATEHRSVLDTCRRLAREGWRVTYLPVDRGGLLDLSTFAAALTPGTVMASVMAANNEIGTIQPLARIGAICRERGVVLHTDATQAIGKVPFDVGETGVGLASFTAHKLHGPKGVGALYVRSRGPRVRLEPLVEGGGHERGLRSGTLNVPGIVGFGAAVELAARLMPVEAPRIAARRDRLRNGIMGVLDGVHENGAPASRLPNNLNLRFDHVEGEALLMALDGIAVSPGAACSSAEPEPSHVLTAIGLSSDEAQGALRFGLSRFTTEEEVEETIRRVVAAVSRLRQLSGMA